MRQMTLRDIPDEIEMLARSEAERQHISLNKAFLSLLAKSTEKNRVQLSTSARKSGASFSRFCGVWSDDEAAEFDKVLNEQRGIDNKVWQ